MLMLLDISGDTGVRVREVDVGQVGLFQIRVVTAEREGM